MTKLSLSSLVTSLAFSDTYAFVVTAPFITTGLLLRSVATVVGFTESSTTVSAPLARSVVVSVPLARSVVVFATVAVALTVSVAGSVVTGLLSFEITILLDSFGIASPSVGLAVTFEPDGSISAPFTACGKIVPKITVPTTAEAKPTPLNLRNE